MRRIALFLLAVSALSISAGCHSDIVVTRRAKELTHKCVYVEPLDSEDPRIGQVIRDIVEKEFVRRRFDVCKPENATMFISGSAFLTTRSTSEKSFFGASAASSQAIESVSLVVKDSDGKLLASASYDNKERYTASRLAKELGGALANRLK